MKKLFSLILAIALVFCVFSNIPVSAASVADCPENLSDSYIQYLDDGSYFVVTLETDSSNISALATTKTGTKTTTYYSPSNEALCALRIVANFSYNGNTVSCTGTSYNTYSYNSLWTVENVTTSHSGLSTNRASATANGNAVQRILGIKIKTAPCSVTVYCDKNGNIS